MTNHLESELMAMARLAKANGHGDLIAPESVANHKAALVLAATESCNHCGVYATLTPAARQRWIVELLHEHHCPRHEDNTDAVVRDATPGGDAA